METEELLNTLETLGRSNVPLPDPHFLNNLEQWLVQPRAQVVSIDRATAKRSRAPRMIRRTVIGSIVAAASIGAGLVAAQQLQARLNDATTTPAHGASTVATLPVNSDPLPSEPVSTIGPRIVTTIPLVTTVVVPAADIAPVEARTRASTRGSATGEATTKPVGVTTIRPVAESTTAPSVASSENRPPVTLTMSCNANLVDGGPGGNVTCTWSRSSSPDLKQYRLLRIVPGDTRGQVFLTNDASYRDVSTTPGVAYTYMVQALRTSGTTIESSRYVVVTWPKATTTTTTTRI